MAKTLMSKTGYGNILVSDSMVDQHRALGWQVVSGAITIAGADMPVDANPALGSGVLESLLARHYQIAPAAVGVASVHAAAALGAAAQDILGGFSQPDFPRTLTIKGNVAEIVADVVIQGTNILDESISDVIALSGTDEVESVMAFKSVTKVSLPAQTHTPVAQVETASAAGTITGNGNASVTVTAAGMTGTPKTIAVPVLQNDTANTWAGKVRTALGADAAITALFNVGGNTNKIVLTRKTPAANDSTLNIALADGTCTGITAAASSADTTAGVGYDTVSVGIGKKFGLPHIVKDAALLLIKLFNGSADNGALAVDADEIEKNLFALDGTPDGEKLVDLFYLA